ncbi:MAG: polysaccharide deacetylase [Ruminococcaceae bacterium]|nr:polysaccharide deacetylase [Oscillospiraceae bacterium]
MDFKNSGKLKAVTFSYDDAVVQDVQLIELLNKYGLKCTFNLNSGFLGGSNFLDRVGKRICHYKIKAEDVKYVYEGHEVAVHTVTHPLLTEISDSDIIYQVEEDRKRLEELVGYDIVGMAYPCGRANKHVANVIRDNTAVKYCRTIQSTHNFDEQKNLYLFDPSVYHLDFDNMMDLGKQFVESKPEKPQIFYIWGHAFEMDYDSKNWVKLEEFFELIANHDDICYCTNKEALL